VLKEFRKEFLPKNINYLSKPSEKHNKLHFNKIGKVKNDPNEPLNTYRSKSTARSRVTQSLILDNDNFMDFIKSKKKQIDPYYDR